eukprot:2513169-Amphidinium_carterae.1
MPREMNENSCSQDDPELVRRQQAILGSLLWLSTRSRPDLSDLCCGQSILAYCCGCNGDSCNDSTPIAVFTHSSYFGVSLLGYGDSSYAPMGLHSQIGLLVFRVMTKRPQVMHSVSWGSTKQKRVIAQSSCEAELLALKETHHQLGLIGVPMEEVDGWRSNRRRRQYSYS